MRLVSGVCWVVRLGKSVKESTLLVKLTRRGCSKMAGAQVTDDATKLLEIGKELPRMLLMPATIFSLTCELPSGYEHTRLKICTGPFTREGESLAIALPLHQV